MATVTNTVKLPDGSTPDRVDVVIELVASTTGKAAGWITASDVTIEATVRPTVTNGAWTASLTPNADITPSGSVYKVTEYVDKTRYTHYITVGSGGGSLFDLLVDAPASVASAALTSHIDDATAAHAATAVSVADSGARFAATDVETALAELYDASQRRGVRLIPLGDSTVAAGTTASPFSWGPRDWWAWAHITSGGRFRYIRNAGVGGDNVIDLINRFETDVAAYSPNVVPITVGINDAVDGTAFATYAARVRTLIGMVRQAGAQPWLSTVAPNTNTGAVQQRIDQYNTWLRLYTAAEGIPLIDVHSALVDPSDGQYLAAYDLDGTHQNEAGAKVMAAKAVEVINQELPRWQPPLLTFNTTDARSIFLNGCFLNEAGGLATSWLQVNGTTSIVTGDSNIIGNWQRLTDNGAATATLRQNSTTGWTVGDTISVSGRVRVVNGTSTATTLLFINFVGSGLASYILNAVSTDVDGAFEIVETIPAGTTTLQVQMARVATVGGNGYGQLAQVAVRNLTTLGVLTA